MKAKNNDIPGSRKQSASLGFLLQLNEFFPKNYIYKFWNGRINMKKWDNILSQMTLNT